MTQASPPEQQTKAAPERAQDYMVRRAARRAASEADLAARAAPSSATFAHRPKRRNPGQTRQQRDPIRRKAQDALHQAVRSGKIKRPGACEACGVACRPEGHHADYAEPLVVVWLCRECHEKADKAGG